MITAAYLDEGDVRILAAAKGSRPHVEIQGRCCLLHARLRRCFPLTAGTTYVAVFDSEWKEAGILRDTAKLDKESRDALEAELDSFYFTPSIDRILSLKQEASMWRWKVATQRGDAEFFLRGVRDSVHEVAPGRWQIYSVDGQRYEIRSLESLDAKSQNLFEGLF